MSYPYCPKCQARRDAVKVGGIQCEDKTGHKSKMRWMADVHPVRGAHARLRKLFDSEKEADAQETNWQADFNRTGPQMKVEAKLAFEVVADEWWTNAVVVQGKIKNPQRSEKSRYDMWVALFKERPIRSITVDEIEDWITERREDGIAINTINRDLKPLRWILNYAMTKKYIIENPLAKFPNLKNGNIHDRWMTEEEVNHFVKTAIEMEDLELADFIAVGVNTGFRCGNLERLAARDIGEELIEARQTKSGKPYTVPVAPALTNILNRLIMQHPTGPLLPNRNNNKIDVRFRECARKAGLYKDKNDLDRVTIHTLRHTYAVLYLKRGGNLYKLSQFLGHASSAITEQVYARFCPKEKVKEAPLTSTIITHLEAPVLKVV